MMSMSPTTERETGVPHGIIPLPCVRPEARGKFLFLGGVELSLRGVTYGTFREDRPGAGWPDVERVERDFASMAAHGINSVRVYTVPPRWVMDLAHAHALRLLVGLPWEQHVAFLSRADGIEAGLRAGVRACAGHPALLGFAIGNEIPASVVRWHGRRAVERFLHRLYRAAKEEDPGALVTYVNYPSTEYLRLPFLDFCAFNVYLEDPSSLAAYVARLHHGAGNRPLLLAEVGLDSRRHGLAGQASGVGEQIRVATAAGCAGVWVFAWTDDWNRGGEDVLDWDFGLTTRGREPKPALASAADAFRAGPAVAGERWPRISVVVCTYNGSRTLGETLAHLGTLGYPDYEVIVVDDGSRDGCGELARRAGVRVIRTPNRGLSAARNTGWQAATGEIVAYLDDDAYPHSRWLQHLAVAFRGTRHAAIGGPNIPPPGDGWVAECVANAPGGPTHVLLTDTEAEHIPGCNMAFRRIVLEAIGGFDPRFRVAGDDVDVCWKIHERGWTIGFCAAAMVWHHRRDTVGGYWRQQRGYGRAEALLERKWPAKYNSIGHVRWSGRVYGPGIPRALLGRSRVYQGVWGTAPFQTLEEKPPGRLALLATIPEWYLVCLGLAGLSVLGGVWPKLLLAVPLLVLAVGLMAWSAAANAFGAVFAGAADGGRGLAARRWLTACLHVVQPLARLQGRFGSGLPSPWRGPGGGFALPLPTEASVWSETWRAPEAALEAVAARLARAGVPAMPGGAHDRWDLEVRGGLMGAARVLALAEEHGRGRQLFRFQYWPRFSPGGIAVVLVLSLLGLGAAADGQWTATYVLAGLAATLSGRMSLEAGSAMSAMRRAMRVDEPKASPVSRPLHAPLPPVAVES